MADPKIVVGLGNPGPEYAGSPHNAGFEAVHKLREILKAPKFRSSELFLFSEVRIKGEHSILALPQTYMNRSGLAVKALSDKHGVNPSDIIVCYDDLDLPFGSVKLRPHGGAGGHHGMESVIEELGTRSFPRVRIGVRDESLRKDETVDYLLAPLDGGRFDALLESCAVAAGAMRDALYMGWNRAMNLHNKKPSPPEEAGKGEDDG